LKLIEDLRDAEVLIILPSNELVSKYKEYFEGKISPQSLTFFTPEEDWLSATIQKRPHIFIDEYCASASLDEKFEIKINKISKLYSLLNLRQMIWITMDLRQGQKARFQFPSLNSSIPLNSELFDISYLMMFHRCTSNVLKNYRDFCGPLTDIGHQHQGKKNETIRSKCRSGDVSKDWAKLVEKKMSEQNSKGWRQEDVAIVVVVHDSDSLNLYFKLKSKSFKSQVFLECETLSHEWPVVILCIHDENVIPFCYVGYSRAIFKQITILRPSPKTQEHPCTEQFIISAIAALSDITNAKFHQNNILFDMSGFLQSACVVDEIFIVRHLKIYIVDIIKKLNYWITYLIDEVTELNEVII